MKKWIFLTAMSLMLVPLQAQEAQKWVALQGGYDWQREPSRNAEGNGIVGLAAGTWCTPRWGGEVSLLTTRLNAQTGGASSSETHGMVSALFNLDPGSPVCTPYLRAGAGVTQLDQPFSLGPAATVRPSFHAGFGVQSFSTDHILFGAEARVVRVGTWTPATEIMGLVTLGFRWGGSAPAPAPVAAAPAPVPPPPAPKPVPSPAPVQPPPAAKAPVAMPAPAPAPRPVLAKIVLDDAVLHFANGKHVLPKAGILAVRKVTRSLEAYHGHYTLVVTGFTSSVGSPAFNLTLSRQRAEAVAQVLEQSGIPAGSIQTVGAGPEHPVASNSTRIGQAKNRRVEIEVKAAGAQVETQTVDTDTTEE